jgi:hypothetical protein
MVETIGMTWWGEGAREGKIPPPQYFFYLKIVFLVPELNRGK